MKETPRYRPGLLTIVLGAATLAVLAFSAPGSLREAVDRGAWYIFSGDFFADIPKRLMGPGRFRFVLQPLVAILLGIRGGLADARMGRPAYLWGLLFKRELRREFFKTGFVTAVNLVLMGILLDSVFQWFILGKSYPGAAVVVGPVLVATPYSIARALANRCARLRGGV